MKFIYLLIILFFGIMAVYALTEKYDIKKAIKRQEDRLSRIKESLENGMFSKEFIGTLYTAIAIFTFFIKAVVFCFALIGFKSIFG